MNIHAFGVLRIFSSKIRLHLIPGWVNSCLPPETCPVSFFLSIPYSLHEVLFIHIIRIVYICSKFVSPYNRTCSSAMQEFSINMRSITSTDIVLTSSKRWSLSCTAYRVRQRRWSVILQVFILLQLVLSVFASLSCTLYSLTFFKAAKLAPRSFG
jgi:hypothetical protein